MGKLTKHDIDQAQATSRDLFLWDSSLPGFGLRVKPTGAKTFVIQYRNRQGRSRRQKIGRYGTLTLDQARRLARDELAQVTQGRDPRQERVEQRQATTIKDLAERYMTDHCEGRCKPSTIAAHNWLLKKYILPRLGRLTLPEVTSSAVDRFHQSLKATPYNANRCLGLLCAMWGRAEFWKLIPKDDNPTSEVKKFKEHKRRRFLSFDELKQLAIVLDKAERSGAVSPFVVAAFRLLLVTGARLNEIRKLRWRSVDFQNRQLIIEDHKTDKDGAKLIPLNRVALEILRSIPRDPENPYVIQGTRPGLPYSDLEKPWRALRKLAGLEDVRIHDLRHSFASFGIGLGVSLPTVGGLLGQGSLQATMIYAHLPDDPKRLASESVGEVIASHLLPAPPSKEGTATHVQNWRERVSKGKQANLRGRKAAQRAAISARG